MVDRIAEKVAIFIYRCCKGMALAHMSVRVSVCDDNWLIFGVEAAALDGDSTNVSNW